MTKKEILEVLKKLVGEAMGNNEIVERISCDSDLINEIGMDSLTIINFVLLAEDELDIEIDFDDFDVGYLQT